MNQKETPKSPTLHFWKSPISSKTPFWILFFYNFDFVSINISPPRMAAKPRNSKWRLLRWRPTLIDSKSSQRKLGEGSLTPPKPHHWSRGFLFDVVVQERVRCMVEVWISSEFKEPGFLSFFSCRLKYPPGGKIIDSKCRLIFGSHIFRSKGITLGGEKGLSVLVSPCGRQHHP